MPSKTITGLRTLREPLNVFFRSVPYDQSWSLLSDHYKVLRKEVTVVRTSWREKVQRTAFAYT